MRNAIRTVNRMGILRLSHVDISEPDLELVWPAPHMIGDVQAGMPGTRQPDGTVIYGTAAAGNAIYRGDRLPRDLVGDYLHGEAVARSVRRLRPVKTEGLTQLRNVYPRREFIRSLDPGWREEQLARTPLGRFATPDEVAAAVLVAVRDLTSTTGSILAVDAGRPLA